MFGFKLKFPFRITGISTLWGGLSWEYCDSSKESKGKEITLDSNSKIFVFISSKCQPEKYKNIRAVLKQQLEDTGIFSVYIFEEAGASSTSPQNKYLTQLIRSDVCIFLIDNKDGITEGVQQEIDVALKHEKKCLFYFCEEKSLEKPEIFETIRNSGFCVYYTVKSFEEFVTQSSKDLVNDILELYKGYCNKLVFYHPDEISSFNVEQLKQVLYPKSIVSDLNKTASAIINFSGMQIDLTEREEYKSSELDYWCALFFGVLFGNESIDSFNLHKFSKVILKNRKDSYDKIVEKRWEALEAYFSNNSEKCLNCLNEAKKIAGNSDGWIQNDIDLDIRNVYRYQAHTLSDILLLGKKSSSAEDNNISEETYYPGIDRITNNLNEKFFSESVSDRLDYGLSFTISNELVGCAQQLASILAIAMYYGSLSHLLLMFRYVKYFMAYLSFKYDNFQFRYSYLKLAIWDNNKDDIDGILREFPDLYNKLSNDSVKEVIDLSKNHHEVYHELKSKMLAFKYLGYYLSDSNFIKVFNDLDLCVRNLYTDDYEGALLVNEWLNCLPHVRHRLSFVEFCNPLFYYIESNKTLNFSEVLLFVWNHVNIEELSSKKQKKLIEYFKMHLNEKHLGNIQRSGKLLTFFRIEYGEKFSFLDDVFRKLKDTLEELYLSYFIMGPLSRPRSKILRVAVSRIILSSEASKVKLVGNLVA